MRINRTLRAVEFDGTVPIDAHDPETPDVFLEVIVCIPDTKEHESLVVTDAMPSEVHAALLAIGAEPGRPGSWQWNGTQMTSVAPTGSSLDVRFMHSDGSSSAIGEWTINSDTGERFGADGRWVFAGSRFVEWQGREFYDADGTGTLVGLTTFGSETVAWSDVISHESRVQAPVWKADNDTMPRLGTPVTVRIELLD